MVTPKNRSKPARLRHKAFLGFNLLLAFWMSLPLLMVGGFNWWIDPYGIYHEQEIYGINHDKPSQEYNDRLYKAIAIINHKPNTLLLGSSRVKRGLDPHHPSLQDASPVYNLGLNNANIYELRRYLEHSITNNPQLKRVILGLDFFMFNEHSQMPKTFAEYRLNKTHITFPDLLNTTLSLDTLQASQKTIQKSLKTRKSELNSSEDGFIPYQPMRDGNTTIRFHGSTKLYLKLHSDYKLSETHLKEFTHIVSICQQNHIDLIVYFSPAHAIHLESIYAPGKWSVLEEWKRQIVQIIPVWDFFNYNTVTTEPLTEEMNYYVDESHYTKPVGDLLLTRIFGDRLEQVPPDFGLLLTPENINHILRQNRLDRKHWSQIHPDEVEFVKSLQSELIQNSQGK